MQGQGRQEGPQRQSPGHSEGRTPRAGVKSPKAELGGGAPFPSAGTLPPLGWEERKRGQKQRQAGRRARWPEEEGAGLGASVTHKASPPAEREDEEGLGGGSGEGAFPSGRSHTHRSRAEIHS